MKNINLILTTLSVSFIFLSCEKEEFNDVNIFSAINSNSNYPFYQNHYLISSWSFENSLEDIISHNDFCAQLNYYSSRCIYVPERISTAIRIISGQLKCDMKNNIITDGKDFSFFFWAKGYNQQDKQEYFCLKSYYFTNNYLNINVERNFSTGKMNDYLVYIHTNDKNNNTTLTTIKINKDQEWYFYGITYEKPYLKFYINDELKATIEWDYQNYYVDNYYVLFAPCNYFNDIYIDNAKLYNKAFKPNEVKALYKSKN